jgi:hypothetical protein
VQDGSVAHLPRGDARIERPDMPRPRIDVVGDEQRLAGVDGT